MLPSEPPPSSSSAQLASSARPAHLYLSFTFQSDGGSIVPLETTGRLLVTFGGLGTGAGIKSVTVVVKRGDRSATKGSFRVVTREILVSVRFL